MSLLHCLYVAGRPLSERAVFRVKLQSAMEQEEIRWRKICVVCLRFSLYSYKCCELNNTGQQQNSEGLLDSQ